MKKTVLLAVVGGLMMSTSAFAKNYGQAGCGLGSMWIGSDPGLMQILAGTTNGLFMNQWFGISFGTSNCDEGGDHGSLMFIESNKVALANDVARGSGETLASLSSLYGCESASFGAALQKNYDRIFPSAQASAEQIDSAIRNVVTSEASCQI